MNTGAAQFPQGGEGNQPQKSPQTRDENDLVPTGLVMSISPSTPAEEPPRYLGSLGKLSGRKTNSTPASLSRNRGRAIAPVISNNSLRAAVDDAGSLSSLAISGIELRAFASTKPSREPSTFKSPEPEPQPVPHRVDGVVSASGNHARKETSPQRVSFDNPPSDKREPPRLFRKSDPMPPPSPILRAMQQYRDRHNASPAVSPPPSRPRSRAPSPFRAIQQWSSSLYRARSPSNEPFVPVNPFKSARRKPSAPVPCKTCSSKQQHQFHHQQGPRGSPMPELKSIPSSDIVFNCNHVVPLTSLNSAVEHVRIFFGDTLPRHIYLTLLLRLPALYFSRVSKIFEDADLSKPDVERMIRAGGGGGFFSLPSRSDLHSPDRGVGGSNQRLPGSRTVSPGAISAGIRMSSQVAIAPGSQIILNQPLPCPEDWAAPLVSPALLRFKSSWEAFIDSLMKEWKTLNVVSALLLSAICSIFQTNAGSDPVVRNAAFMSLICALLSLSYGCTYIIRFGSMRSMYRAARWAEEAKKSKTSLWWNVWVFLAMPAVWIAWSMLWFIASILSFVWRTGADTNPDQPPPISFHLALIPRIVITAVFLVGLTYFILIIGTLQSYGSHGGFRQFFDVRPDADTVDLGKMYDAAERGERRDREPTVTRGPVETVDSKTERRGRERERRASGSGGSRRDEDAEQKREENVIPQSAEGQKNMPDGETETARVVGLGLTTEGAL